MEERSFTGEIRVTESLSITAKADVIALPVPCDETVRFPGPAGDITLSE